MEQLKEIDEELEQFLNEIPSGEIREMMQAEIAAHRSNIDGLKASKILEDSQLKIIDGLQAQVNSTIEAIKNWPLRGRHGLIGMGKRPADLGKNVYKLLEDLDLTVPASKRYYDKTTALLERVVNYKTEDIEIELRNESDRNNENEKLPRPQPHKPEKAETVVAKELSDFENSLLEQILKLPLKVETAYLKLFRGIIECALRKDSAGEQRHQAKIVELLTKGVDMGVYSHLLNAWNNVRSGVFQDAIELYKILFDSYPEYSELNSLMIQILASKIKADGSVEKTLVQKAENILRSDRELNAATRNDYMELIRWAPESSRLRKYTKPSEMENPKTLRSVKKSG